MYTSTKIPRIIASRIGKRKEESERRRQSGLPTDITGKPKRVIVVDSIISTFDSGEDKVPGEDTYIPHRSPEHPSTPDPDLDSDTKDTPHSSPINTPERPPIPSPKYSPSRPSRTPTPTESPESPGKKGEDPEDHILKVEDYLGVHQITAEGDKISRFKDTLFKTARKWAQTLNYDEVKKFDYNPDNPNDKKISMKYLFLARFAKEGRTLEAAYNAWGILTFDPDKDDIEQFILKVEELAKKLGYNEDTQVMAVRSVLPRDVYGICMTHKNLKDLKTVLIELFSNSKMREAVPGIDSATRDPSVFSIGKHMENNVVNPLLQM